LLGVGEDIEKIEVAEQGEVMRNGAVVVGQ